MLDSLTTACAAQLYKLVSRPAAPSPDEAAKPSNRVSPITRDRAFSWPKAIAWGVAAALVAPVAIAGPQDVYGAIAGERCAHGEMTLDPRMHVDYQSARGGDRATVHVYSAAPGEADRQLLAVIHQNLSEGTVKVDTPQRAGESRRFELDDGELVVHYPAGATVRGGYQADMEISGPGAVARTGEAGWRSGGVSIGVVAHRAREPERDRLNLLLLTPNAQGDDWVATSIDPSEENPDRLTIVRHPYRTYPPEGGRQDTAAPAWGCAA